MTEQEARDELTNLNSREVVILGPNLRTKDGYYFHVHRSDCSDVQKRHYANVMAESWTLPASTPQDVVEEVYSDQIEESEGHWSEYLSEFKFFPCAFVSVGSEG